MELIWAIELTPIVTDFPEDGSSVDASRFIVLPQCSILKVGDVKEIQMLIHPKVKGQLEPLAFKLNLFWGDEALRNRWIK